MVNAGGNAQTPIQRHVKRQRSIAPNLYRQRNSVERFFNKLNHFRRIATRCAKLDRNSLAAVMLAAIRLWLGAYESTIQPPYTAKGKALKPPLKARDALGANAETVNHVVFGMELYEI